MKIVELIKVFKFLDFKKYISANLIAITFLCFSVLTLVHALCDFPPPVPVNNWGEPYYEYCPEEQKLINGTFVCIFIMFFLAALMLIEFLTRVVIEFISKKFFSKEIKKQISFKMKIPKPVILIHSIVFYTGFIPFVLFSIYLFLSSK